MPRARKKVTDESTKVLNLLTNTFEKGRKNCWKCLISEFIFLFKEYH